MMKKSCIIAILITILTLSLHASTFLSSSEDMEYFLSLAIQAAEQSKEIGSLRNSDTDFILLVGKTTLPFLSEQQDIMEAEATIVTLNAYQTTDNRYLMFEGWIYPSFTSMKDDNPTVTINSQTSYYSIISHKLSTISNRTLFSWDNENHAILKKEYTFHSVTEEIFLGHDCYVLEFKEPYSGSITKWWIDRETSLKLREDFYQVPYYLTKRTINYTWKELSDGSLIEDRSTIWDISDPNNLHVQFIIDCMEIDVPDDVFERETLKKYL